jgi:hypothetical protein
MNEKKITLIGNVIKYVLIAVGIILCLFVIVGPNAMSADKKLVEDFRDGAVMTSTAYFTGFVLFACAAAIVGFYIHLLITDFKRGIKSMTGIIAFGVLYFLLKVIGTSDTSATLNLKNPVSDAVVDGTHAGLVTCIIGLAVAIVAIVAGPFIGRYRK